MSYNLSLSIIGALLFGLLSIFSSCVKLPSTPEPAPPAQRNDSPPWPKAPSGASPVHDNGNNGKAVKAKDFSNETKMNANHALEQSPVTNTANEASEKPKRVEQPASSPK